MASKMLFSTSDRPRSRSCSWCCSNNKSVFANQWTSFLLDGSILILTTDTDVVLKLSDTVAFLVPSGGGVVVHETQVERGYKSCHQCVDYFWNNQI